jgi:hypothetical protein
LALAVVSTISWEAFGVVAVVLTAIAAIAILSKR